MNNKRWRDSIDKGHLRIEKINQSFYTTKVFRNIYSIDCNTDLQKLKSSCLKVQEILNNKESSVFFRNNSTFQYRPKNLAGFKEADRYTLFRFPYAEFQNLLMQLKNSFHKVYEEEYNKIVKDRFYIKSWCNIFYKNNFYDWHNHTHWNQACNKTFPSEGTWHGCFYVDAEPSKISYKFKDNTIIDVPCKNNTVLISSNNIDHRTYEWLDETRPRITIAFDILPYNIVSQMNSDLWIPL